jgi:hypothetical protein
MTEQFSESQVAPKGWVTITKTNELGQITDQFEVPNLVVTAGKIYIAGKMIATDSNVPIAMSHMGIGTGTASPVAEDTGLGTQTGRVLLSGSLQDNNSITYTATFPAGTGTGAITEAGIFNAGTGGTMLCRTVFPVVTKQAGDTIAVTWKVTVS